MHASAMEQLPVQKHPGHTHTGRAHSHRRDEHQTNNYATKVARDDACEANFRTRSSSCAEPAGSAMLWDSARKRVEHDRSTSAQWISDDPEVWEVLSVSPEKSTQGFEHLWKSRLPYVSGGVASVIRHKRQCNSRDQADNAYCPAITQGEVEFTLQHRKRNRYVRRCIDGVLLSECTLRGGTYYAP